MLALLLALQAAAPGDSLPRVTLAEALQRSARLDPNYVAALGQVDNAAWARRSAFAVFILPSVTLGTDATEYKPAFFNFATLQPEPYSVSANVTLRYDVFTGGQKLAELARSAAALDGAHANELAQRFATALFTERDYYGVLAGQELARVARDRVRRGEEQLAVARARVASGAVSQTDSLQLRLELARARTALLERELALRVARLQLGRRVGADGPVDATPLDTVLAPELPITLADAITRAAAQGPQYRVAQANERAASAQFRARLGAFLPRATLQWQRTGFDNKFAPALRSFNALTLSVAFPLWDNGQREIALSQARVNRDVARAIRDDMDRAVTHDVTAAYDGYVTARASTALAAEGAAAARVSFRVQQSRYSSGATTILDLVDAQVNLSEAESQFVQARYATRLALAGLEAILGRRLFSDKDSQ
ncbi:MAG TPA: TolC family protein [Gemmatimonadales bacterium]|jgi:outer membrane protein TolC|nr:TolC family protein [Gemmatimonadales bacterium]